MFGEYGLYCDEKIVALICDDTLFIKPTAISPSFFTDADLAPPYPGTKDYYAVPGDRLDDHECSGRSSHAAPNSCLCQSRRRAKAALANSRAGPILKTHVILGHGRAPMDIQIHRRSASISGS